MTRHEVSLPLSFGGEAISQTIAWSAGSWIASRHRSAGTMSSGSTPSPSSLFPVIASRRSLAVKQSHRQYLGVPAVGLLPGDSNPGNDGI